MKIEIKNLKEFNEFMEKKKEAIKKMLPSSVKDAVIYLHGKVKESIARGTFAPVAVDTGRFLNSVDFAGIDENTAKIFSELEYAQFIEFGTSKMNARPHFRNTAMAEEANVKWVFNNDLKKAID